MRLAFAESVFGRYGTAQCYGFTGEFCNQILGAFGLLTRFRQDVHVNVSVANMSEDHVLSGELTFERLAIDADHLTVAVEGHGKIGIVLEHTTPANQVIHGFGQSMAKPSESLAIDI